MKFLYSDTQDWVDPSFDFINETSDPDRKRYWDDRYAHEIMSPAPYDGLLVAMSGVVDPKNCKLEKARYSTSEAQRFLRSGVRKFLRYDSEKFEDCMVMGDCGAFAYSHLDEPPYEVEEVYDFYQECGFTHGISPDHIIFDYREGDMFDDQPSSDERYRQDITLKNAKLFLELCRSDGMPFVPIGPVQGWSPGSLASCAQQLEEMGYEYLAIGGLVPLKSDQIKRILLAVREVVKASTKIHLLGFAKAESISEYVGLGVDSFDSTSPLIRAFKDKKANYYLPKDRQGLNYFAAIRIPQSLDSAKLLRGVKQGLFTPELLVKHEKLALGSLRALDQGIKTLEEALPDIENYLRYLYQVDEKNEEKLDEKIIKNRPLLVQTLTVMPWKQCDCSICKDVGVEVIIFRGSNRNKRRGFHNLGVFHRHVKGL